MKSIIYAFVGGSGGIFLAIVWLGSVPQMHPRESGPIVLGCIMAGAILGVCMGLVRK